MQELTVRYVIIVVLFAAFIALTLLRPRYSYRLPRSRRRAARALERHRYRPSKKTIVLYLGALLVAIAALLLLVVGGS